MRERAPAASIAREEERVYAGRHTAFDTAHPLVPAVYATLTIGLTMFAFQPVLIVISLAGGLLYECVYDGPRAAVMSLRW